MNDNYTNTELLSKYLDGELEPEELKNLETRIKQDNDLRQELDYLKISLEAIKSYGSYERVSSIHEEMMKEFEKQPSSTQKAHHNILWYTLRIAAAVIIIAGGALFYQYTMLTSASLYQDNISNYTIHANRGVEVQPKLEQEYELAHYGAVTEIFRQKPVKMVQDYFIAGNAYLQLDRPAEAIQCFLGAQHLNKTGQTHIYTDDIEYYLAMSYLKNKEKAKALSLFNKIHKDKGHLYHSKVSGWFIKKLNWLNDNS